MTKICQKFNKIVPENGTFGILGGKFLQNPYKKGLVCFAFRWILLTTIIYDLNKKSLNNLIKIKKLSKL